MVIDTSALIAIALGEPLRQMLLDRIEAAADRAISSVSLLEAGIVLRARLGPAAVPVLYELIEELGVEVVAFDGAQARAAIAAFGRFGKGMGQPAQLNFRDCAVYALAQLRSDPLLAIGNDFAATDINLGAP
jgi:ribonuclease VapC